MARYMTVIIKTGNTDLLLPLLEWSFGNQPEAERDSFVAEFKAHVSPRDRPFVVIPAWPGPEDTWEFHKPGQWLSVLPKGIPELVLEHKLTVTKW